MRIALVVPGRFHAFQLAGALIRRGHELTILTNYPGWLVRRFNPVLTNTVSCVPHAVASRLLNHLPSARTREFCLSRSLVPFTRWSARQLRRNEWNCVHCYSGASLEILEELRETGTPSVLFRGSAHIRTQAWLLSEESKRSGVPVQRPGEWMIEREEREYELATKILTLSTFSRDSFLEEGVAADKVAVVSLGVDTSKFQASRAVVEQRSRRILNGEPLRVLFVGTLSMQKGLLDLLQIMERLPPAKFQWRLVGSLTPEVRSLLPRLKRMAEILPQQPHHTIHELYTGADLFVFPTIQDGFAAVLAEARANALPVLTTTNSGGPDLIAHGRDGWVLPIRRPDLFANCLSAAERDRTGLAEMVWQLYANYRPRTWDDAASDFEAVAYSIAKHPHAWR